MKEKQMIEKPDLISIEDEIRQRKYQEFIEDSDEIEKKIRRFT